MSVEERETESTQTELLARIKAQRTPDSKEQPEAEAVDVSVETADEETELEAGAEVEEEIVEESDEPSEDEQEAEESEELIYEIGDKQITLKQLEELEQGNLRQSDYTQKTQSLADERKAFDVSQSTQKEMSDTLQSHIDVLNELNTAKFKDIDWDELRDLDTSEYLKLKEEQESMTGKLADATSKRNALIEDQKKGQQLKGNDALFALNPLWIKDGKATKVYADDQKLLGNTASDFSQEEIDAALSSGKIMQAMIDAARYRELKSKASSITKKVKKAPVVVKGKKPSGTNLDRQIKEAHATLKRTGKVEDAMALTKLKRQL